MTSVGREACPTCGQSVNERRIAMSKHLVIALLAVWKWCRENGVTKFARRDVSHLFGNEAVTATFANWLLFGGLLFRPEDNQKKGHYQFNVERTEAFFKGELEIPMTIWKDQLTGELSMEDFGTIDKVPDLRQMLDDDGYYVAEYRK